jgi:hypothetical protein
MEWIIAVDRRWSARFAMVTILKGEEEMEAIVIAILTALITARPR